MRLVAVVAAIGLATAHAEPLELTSVADTSTDGVHFLPIDRPPAMSVVASGGMLRLTTSVTKLFDANAYRVLGDGMTTTIHIHVVITRAGSNDPIAVRRIVRTAHFDLWDERYKIEQDGATRTIKLKADALSVLTTLDREPLARVADLPPDELAIVVIAELDPITEQARAEVEGWVPKSAFGRLVSMFVDAAPDAADRVLRARSSQFRF